MIGVKNNNTGKYSQVGNGHNWCSPYKQWQAQHGNDPYAILELQVNPLQKPMYMENFIIDSMVIYNFKCKLSYKWYESMKV